MSSERSFDRLTVIVTGATAALGALIAFGDKMENFAQSSFFAYLYMIKDLFLFELIALFVLFVSRRWWLRRLTDFPDDFAASWRAGPQFRRRVIFHIALATLALCSALSQVPGYARSKYHTYRHYGATLSDRAAEQFLDGDAQSAVSTIQICAIVKRGCADITEALERREQWVKLFRDIYPRVNAGSPARAQLLAATYMQNRDWDEYDKKLKELQEQNAAASKAFELAIRSYKDGDNRMTSEQLALADALWNNFGHAREIQAEITASTSSAKPTVYLRALMQMGTDSFLRQIAHEFKVPRLTHPVTLSEDGISQDESEVKDILGYEGADL